MWVVPKAQSPHQMQKALSAKTRDQELATSQLFSTGGTDRSALLYGTAYNVRTTQIFCSSILYCSQILELCKMHMTIGSYVESKRDVPHRHEQSDTMCVQHRNSDRKGQYRSFNEFVLENYGSHQGRRKARPLRLGHEEPRQPEGIDPVGVVPCADPVHPSIPLFKRY